MAISCIIPTKELLDLPIMNVWCLGGLQKSITDLSNYGLFKSVYSHFQWHDCFLFPYILITSHSTYFMHVCILKKTIMSMSA
jgi:hypothetical protein